MRKLAVILLAALATAPAWGWSRQGHSLVAELAERELTPAALAQVRELLADEADPRLAAVASWADDVREADPDGRTERWHYLNLPRGGCDYVAARDCPDGNYVVAAINAQRAILADAGRPRQERVEALKFLVHFVGDVHQPMHVGYGDDRGGNKFQVNYRGKGAPSGEGTNLHSVWDYWLLRSGGHRTRTYADLLQQSPVPADAAAGAANPPLAWALESCRLITEDAIYPTRHRLGDAYLDKHRPTAERRVRQAGARLAALLNATLAPAR